MPDRLRGCGYGTRAESLERSGCRRRWSGCADGCGTIRWSSCRRYRWRARLQSSRFWTLVDNFNRRPHLWITRSRDWSCAQHSGSDTLPQGHMSQCRMPDRACGRRLVIPVGCLSRPRRACGPAGRQGTSGGRTHRIGGCLGPWLRRLTPWVAVWAGLPMLHLSGPAAHRGVNAARSLGVVPLSALASPMKVCRGRGHFVRVCAASAGRAFVAGVGLVLACVLGGMACRIGGVFGPMGGCLGPWMRRLTPWVAVWAGLPMLHL